MKTTANMVGLVGIYDTTTTAIKLHAPGCAMLNVTARRGSHMKSTGVVDAADLADWAEREFTVTVCKCAR